MRRIIGTVFQSLDGVMQAPGGQTEDPTGGFAHGGWQMGYHDEIAGAAIDDALAPPFALLLGRRTYDIFAAFWPYATGDGAALGQKFTAADKYVLTRGDQALEWDNSHRVANTDALAAIKAGDGPDLRIWGSSTVYPALLAAGLLDRVVLLTYPLLLGGGKRPFGDGTPAGALRLSEHKVGPSGTIVATYEPAGDLTPPPSPQPPPSPREEERQRRLREGSW